MSRPRRCGRGHIAIVLSLYVALFPSAPLLSTTLSTNLSFPVFQSADDFITFGKIRQNPDNLSLTIDPSGFDSNSRESCVKLYYRHKVWTKNRECRAVASFSTSFTFSLTQQEHSNRSGWLPNVIGFLFTFTIGTIPGLFGGTLDPSIKYFSIEFDTYNSYGENDPSDNHIGVNLNSPNSAYTYNLCGGERTTCSFPWTGRFYTAWIDYNGSTGSLEVWFANGTMADRVVKPADPGLIKVPEVNLTNFFEDYMYVGFSGLSGPVLDTYEILSWNLAVSHSEDMPGPTPKLYSTGSRLRIFDVIYVACGIAMAAIVCLFGYYWRRQPHMDKSELGLGLDLLMGLRRFSFKELKSATNNFNESALLGKGGSGSVYKGTATPSGMEVAVRRLTHNSEHVEREFLAEVSSISQILHKNLVYLEGWCHENGHFLLVFEYMSNGGLDEWLFPSRRRHRRDPKYKKFEVLPWEVRFSILTGIAAAGEYLHEEWVKSILHRDIKSSNMLLDADFSSHLGDFCVARLLDHDKLEKTTTLIAGTFGYIAPEVPYTGKATKEADVYSFGILMLEFICGRRPVNLQVEDPDQNSSLLQSVWRAYETGHILSAVDPELLNVYWHEATTFNVRDVERKIVHLLRLGLQCCWSDPQSRPSMRVVKQVVLQVPGFTEDTMAMLNLITPIRPLAEGEASFIPESSVRSSVLRRRFYTD